MSQAPPQGQETTLLVNARLVPTVENIKALRQFTDAAEQSTNLIALARSGWAVAAAMMPTAIFGSVKITDAIDWASAIREAASENTTLHELMTDELELFEYPHDVVRHHMAGSESAVNHRISDRPGDYREIADGVFVATGGDEVSIGEHTVFDVSGGPVIFESGVRVGPMSFFRGPVHVGANCKFTEHSSIKDGVSIGHTCKIGGEVEGVIVEPYSNKQHHGFLGHSYLGSWINLGAGTCNSDLKNTYGIVNMTYGSRKVPTGMQFMGCVMGDYAKTAINTSIFTGTRIGVGSMLYGFATSDVPPFVNDARSLGQIGRVPPEVIVTMQKRMFARRGISQRPCDIQLIHDMFQMTTAERPTGLSDEPLAL